MQASQDLFEQHLITEFEKTMVEKGICTPMFYGLQKMHAEFVKFPQLRPICSGYDSWGSELVSHVFKSSCKKIAHPTYKMVLT